VCHDCNSITELKHVEHVMSHQHSINAFHTDSKLHLLVGEKIRNL
jgi:hypothetical protein